MALRHRGEYSVTSCEFGCGELTYYDPVDKKYRNEDNSLHSCFIPEEPTDADVAPGVPASCALITYRCPVQGRQLTVGPADYRLVPMQEWYEEGISQPVIDVQCLCGTPHRLNLFDSEV